jgi:RNA-dependent RNA polymerase
MKTPGRLTSETLINLAENGVPHDVLTKLLQEGLDQNVAGLIQWEGEDAMLNLWCTLATKAKVMSSRKSREASTEARARGYQHSETEAHDDENGTDDMAVIQERNSAWWYDEVPTCPKLFSDCLLSFASHQ